MKSSVSLKGKYSAHSPSSSREKYRQVVSSFRCLLKSIHRVLIFFLIFLISCYREDKTQLQTRKENLLYSYMENWKEDLNIWPPASLWKDGGHFSSQALWVFPYIAWPQESNYHQTASPVKKKKTTTIKIKI